MKYDKSSGLVISRIELSQYQVFKGTVGLCCLYTQKCGLICFLTCHKPRHSYIFRNWDTLPCFQINHHSFLSHKNGLQYIIHWSLNIKLTKFGFLSLSHDRFPLFPRHCLQVKNTPTAATASRQNISIPADGICLWPRDPSGAGCHVSNWPVWELAQPKGLLSQGKEGGGGPLPSSLLSPAMATRAANYPPDTAEVSLGKVFKSALGELLLTEWGLWCLKHKGQNQVLPPVRCGSAFCAHEEKEIENSLSHARLWRRLENPVCLL